MPPPPTPPITPAEFKARICQRGAVPPLIMMLTCADVALKEMAAFALGRLAQNPDNQAGIVQGGGLAPLLELLESKQYNLQVGRPGGRACPVRLPGAGAGGAGVQWCPASVGQACGRPRAAALLCAPFYLLLARSR